MDCSILATPGFHILTAWLDSKNAVPEVSEFNNFVSRRFVVPLTTAPSLSISSSNGAVRLTLANIVSGITYKVQRQTNLLGGLWETIATVNTSNTIAFWESPVDSKVSTIFYRVKALDPGEAPPMNPLLISSNAFYVSKESELLRMGSPLAAEYTCEFWVKPETAGTLLETPLFDVSLWPDNTNYVLGFGIDREMHGNVLTTYHNDFSSVNITPKQWHHVVVAYQFNGAKWMIGLGVDGELRWQSINNTVEFPFRKYYLGAGENGSLPSQAEFDEFRVSNSLRYPVDVPNYKVPTDRFMPDSATLMLLHLDENDEADMLFDATNQGLDFLRVAHQ